MKEVTESDEKFAGMLANAMLQVQDASEVKRRMEVQEVSSKINSPMFWIGMLATAMMIIFSLASFIYSSAEQAQSRDILGNTNLISKTQELAQELQTNQKLVTESVKRNTVDTTVNSADIYEIRSTRVKPESLQANIKPLERDLESLKKEIDHLRETQHRNTETSKDEIRKSESALNEALSRLRLLEQQK